jgi:hypothetical protein
MDYLRRNNRELQGVDVVDIGTWDRVCSQAIGVRLSLLAIKCTIKPKMTLENFWHAKKCLVRYVDGES